MKSNLIKEWFLFCSGAFLDILHHEDCRNEHNKYIGIGTAVFFTAVFAFMSGGYGLYTVFKSAPLAILFGLIWACFIFSLDRFIVSTLKKENGNHSESPVYNGFVNKFIELVKASPRLFLAVILAIIISKPLELKIFEREIENELVSMQQGVRQEQEQKVRDRYEPSIKSRNAQIEAWKGETNTKKAKFDELISVANQEADGTGGSKKPKKGPIYRAKKEAADKAEIEFASARDKNQPLIDAALSENSIEESKLRDELSKLKQIEFDGLLARIAALGSLSDKNRTMSSASLAIFLLFLIIELAPLLFKIFSDRGNYDVKLQMLEERVNSREIEEISYLNDEINKRVKIKVGENQNLIERELADNKDLMAKISKAQLDLAQEIIESWKKNQLGQIRENPSKYIGGLKEQENGVPGKSN